MLWSKLSFVIFLQIILSYVLGRAAIPLLRQLKTGKYDAYVGDRFAADGSEPAFGGAVTWIVFAFGMTIAAAVCGQPDRTAAVTLYVLAVTLPGVLDDVSTDVRHRAYLIKSGVKFGYCYAASLVFLLVYERMGYVTSEVLLPFRLGVLDFGAAFCPVMAAVMTLVISAFGLMNRFGADDKTCVDGLCQTVTFVQMIAAAVVGVILSDDGLTAFGYVAAAAAGGSLIWGLAPAKLKNGSSGGYFCGGLAAAAVCFLPRLELAFLLACLAAAADAVCSAVQYLVYRKSRRFLLKGSSLHDHMTAKGMSGIKIILIFSLIAAAACIGTAAYAVYSSRLTV